MEKIVKLHDEGDDWNAVEQGDFTEIERHTAKEMFEKSSAGKNRTAKRYDGTFYYMVNFIILIMMTMMYLFHMKKLLKKFKI